MITEIIEQTEQIEGTLDRAIFKNDSGFLIGAFTDKNSNKFSAIGTMVNPQTDIGYLLTGSWVDSTKYGEQFKFSTYETQLPVDPRGIFNYIVRICRFVGSSVGNAIIDAYGDKTLVIMKTDPDRIANEISGITLDRALDIQSTLLENEYSEQVMVELEALLDVPGMLKRLAGELYAEYKSNAAEIVKANPYILTEFNGVGFPLADQVAIHNGFARDSIERKKAAAIHVMKQNLKAGSTWMIWDELNLEINSLIQVHEFGAGVYVLLEDGIFVRDDDMIAFSAFAEKEKHVADRLAELEAMAVWAI